MAMTFGLNPGAYVSVTAPTIVTLTPLAAGETFPATMTVIPQAVVPLSVPTTPADPTVPTTHAASASPTAVPWEVTFTEKR